MSFLRENFDSPPCSLYSWEVQDDDFEDDDDWSEKTSVEVASFKDLAYLAAEVDELRRGLRTVWVLCILSLASLVVSLGVLAMRPVGVSEKELLDVFEINRTDKMDKVLEILENRPSK